MNQFKCPLKLGTLFWCRGQPKTEEDKKAQSEGSGLFQFLVAMGSKCCLKTKQKNTTLKLSLTHHTAAGTNYRLINTCNVP